MHYIARFAYLGSPSQTLFLTRTNHGIESVYCDTTGVLKTCGEVSKPFSPRAFEKSGLLPDAIPPPFGATEAMMSLSDSRSAFKGRYTHIPMLTNNLALTCSG